MSLQTLSRIYPLQTLFQHYFFVFHSCAQCRKLETNIPRKGIVWPQSQFPHSCVCKRFIYSPDRSAYCCRKVCGPILGIYKSSQINWEWGRAIPFLGIHKWDPRCSVRWLERLVLMGSHWHWSMKRKKIEGKKIWKFFFINFERLFQHSYGLQKRLLRKPLTF
jgi:hypothetical protein